MDEWRVFSTRFLGRALKQYFGVEFEKLYTLKLISDSRLRALLELQAAALANERWDDATCTGKLAFAYASVSLRGNLPSGESSWAFFAKTGAADELGLGDLIRKIDQRFQDIEEYAVVLASGVTPGDYGRYMRTPIHVTIVSGGGPFFERFRGQQPMSIRAETDALHTAIMRHSRVDVW